MLIHLHQSIISEKCNCPLPCPLLRSLVSLGLAQVFLFQKTYRKYQDTFSFGQGIGKDLVNDNEF